MITELHVLKRLPCVNIDIIIIIIKEDFCDCFTISRLLKNCRTFQNISVLCKMLLGFRQPLRFSKLCGKSLSEFFGGILLFLKLQELKDFSDLLRFSGFERCFG